MDADSVIAYITQALGRVYAATGDDNLFFFYDPGNRLPVDRRFPFATLMTNDINDTASNLTRPGVYRLNVGVSKQVFEALFGPQTVTEDDSTYDYTALDELMPHPVYARMRWVCVLNPSEATFEKVKPLLAEAYATAAARYKPTAQPE